MKIKIVKTRRLNRVQARAAAALISCCNSYDGTHYGFPYDADCYYLLYEGGQLAAVSVLFLMGEHLNCRQIYELAAFTLPDRRQRAYFGRLIAAMRQRISGQYVRYAVYANASALETLKARGAEHSHDELMLKAYLNAERHIDAVSDAGSIEGTNYAEENHAAASLISRAGPQEDAYLRITEEAEDRPAADGDGASSCTLGHAQSDFGECYFRIDTSSQNAYIFGVQTYANCLRHGHAYRLLSCLFIELALKGVQTVSLQVSSDNIAALRLYAKLGMREVERLSLYMEQL